MMGHETLQMIHDRYYSYIKNYQRDDGRAFMENVYNASSAQESLTSVPIHSRGQSEEVHDQIVHKVS
jgi:hypothetical protein